MNDPALRFPTTRYSGSKRRLLEFIWEKIEPIKFESALDVFGGTASVSLLLKGQGKRVNYNDLLRFNTLIGTAIIENKGTRVSDSDMAAVLRRSDDHPHLIADNFRGMFYLDAENEWLDNVVHNINCVPDKYKHAIMMSALFQACLAKRPFNLFHRANLEVRTREVKRSFGNKTTWEHPFELLFRRYVDEYNSAIVDNGMHNKAIGGYDAFDCPNGVDLVYLDPPLLPCSGKPRHKLPALLPLPRRPSRLRPLATKDEQRDGKN